MEEELQQQQQKRKQTLPPLNESKKQLDKTPSKQLSENGDQQNQFQRSNSAMDRREPRSFITSHPINSKASNSNKITKPAAFPEKSTFLCFFCGGRTCKRERFDTNPHLNALEGFNSDWITDNIVAMQRPNNNLMLRYRLIDQFKSFQIGGILNLQEPGEHPDCGEGLIFESGFSYSPEEFQKNGIYFFNYGWEDMEVTTLEHLIKIMSAFHHVFHQGKKIAVHCHAGTGRTGVAIVAWLIYGEGMTAKDAITLFRQRRHGSLSKSKHRELLQKFEQFLIHHRRCFDFPKLPVLRIEDLIERQNKVLYGSSKQQCKFLPLPLYVVLEKFKELIVASRMHPKEVCACFYDLENKEYFSQSWSIVFEDELNTVKTKLNSHLFELGQVSDPRIIAQLVLDYFDKIPAPALKDDIIIRLNSKVQGTDNMETVLRDDQTILMVGRYQFEIMNSLSKFGAYQTSFLIQAFQTLRKSAKPQLTIYIFDWGFLFCRKKDFSINVSLKEVCMILAASKWNQQSVLHKYWNAGCSCIQKMPSLYKKIIPQPEKISNDYMIKTNTLQNEIQQSSGKKTAVGFKIVPSNG